MDHLSLDSPKKEVLSTRGFPLHDTIREGLTDESIFLIEQRQIPIDSFNDRKKTPLMIAVAKNQLPLVKSLLAHGANPHLAFKASIKKQQLICHPSIYLELRSYGLEQDEEKFHALLFNMIKKYPHEWLSILEEGQYNQFLEQDRHIFLNATLKSKNIPLIKQFIINQHDKVAISECDLIYNELLNNFDYYKSVVYLMLHLLPTQNKYLLSRLLLHFIRTDSLEGAQACLAQHLNIHERPLIPENDGVLSFFMLSCSYGASRIFSAFLNHEFCISVTPAEYEAAFMMAAQHRQVTICKMLLSKKIIDQTRYDVHFFDAVKKNDLTSIQSMIAADYPINSKNEFQQTALHCAAIMNYPFLFKQLILLGIDYSLKDFYGKTALNIILAKKNLSMLEALLSSTLVLTPETLGEILLLALGKKSSTLIDLILTQAQPIELEYKDHQGHTALHQATRQGHPKLINELLALGADINAVNHEGKTALILSSMLGFEEILSLLLSHHALVDIIDANHQSALHYALGYEHAGSVSLLKEAGAKEGILGNEQSTHTKSVHQSTADAALLLKTRYHRDFEHNHVSLYQEMSAWIESQEPRTIKVRSALSFINSLSHEAPDVFVEPLSQITLTALVGYCWLGLNDSNQCLADSADAKQLLLDGFYECQRGDNLTPNGFDVGGSDRSICYSGMFNKILEKMQGILKGVDIIYLSMETALLKFNSLMYRSGLNYLQSLYEQVSLGCSTLAEFEAVLNTMKHETLEGHWEDLFIFLKPELDEFFDEFKDLFNNDLEHYEYQALLTAASSMDLCKLPDLSFFLLKESIRPLIFEGDIQCSIDVSAMNSPQKMEKPRR
jgi:ankyrin repeat protein